jgi:hypothetical protein
LQKTYEMLEQNAFASAAAADDDDGLAFFDAESDAVEDRVGIERLG